MRPSRRGCIEFAVRKREWIAAVCGHDPQLVPLPSEIGAVNHTFSVRRPVGPRFPCCFLITDFASFAADLHPPKAASAVDVVSVRDIDQFASIRRPRGTDFVIEGAVVIAGKITLVFLSDLTRGSHFAMINGYRKNVQMSGPGC